MLTTREFNERKRDKKRISILESEKQQLNAQLQSAKFMIKQQGSAIQKHEQFRAAITNVNKEFDDRG